MSLSSFVRRPLRFKGEHYEVSKATSVQLLTTWLPLGMLLRFL